MRAEVGVELVDLLKHALVFEGVGDGLEAAGNDFLATHGGEIEGQIVHHREDHPAVDAAMATLGDHRG